MEKKEIIKVGNLFYPTYRSGFAGNVVSTEGIAPCVTAVEGGYREPIVLLKYGKTIKF